MLKKRIIPCLDIKNGRTVKGINFLGLKDAGDPIELAQKYSEEGADELVFLDIAATLENRSTMLELVSNIARTINIPFTVGGGINSLHDAKQVIGAGADKVSINSAAIATPSLVSAIAQYYGSQCVVVAIDTKQINDKWMVFSRGGTQPTLLETVAWAREVERLGAGEILLTSMNSDGTKNGFDLGITEAVSQAINIPIIASGGAGNERHFKALFEQTSASAGLAASIFHYKEIAIPELKKYLQTNKIPTR